MSIEVSSKGVLEYLKTLSTDKDSDISVVNAAADAATQAASSAQSAASSAQTSANSALANASAAQTAANTALTNAAAAQTAADTATASASTALSQLSIVEDVVGVLEWLSEHGTYTATTDTTVNPNKIYFTRSGSGTEQDPYVYSMVTNPASNPQTAGYYELTSIDEAVSNYVSTHLALTNEGLWIIQDNSSYRILISNEGITLYDSGGNSVAFYGDYIRLGDPESARAEFDSGSITLFSEEAEAFSVSTSGGTRDVWVRTGDNQNLTSFFGSSTQTYTVDANSADITSGKDIKLSFFITAYQRYYVSGKHKNTKGQSRVRGSIEFIKGTSGSKTAYIDAYTSNTSSTMSVVSVTVSYDATNDTFTINKGSTLYPIAPGSVSSTFTGYRYYNGFKVYTSGEMEVESARLDMYGDVRINNLPLVDNVDGWYTESKIHLWTNPSVDTTLVPTENFAAQTITSDGLTNWLGSCDEIEIYYVSNLEDGRWDSMRIPIGRTSTNANLKHTSVNYNRAGGRSVVVDPQNASITFGAGYYNGNSGNGNCVPAYIIGIRKIY